MIYFFMILVAVGVDQLTKYWAVTHLMPQKSMEFVPGVLGFHYTENTGAAFSILRDKQLLLIIITLLIIAVLLGMMTKAIKISDPMIVKLSYMLIISGALGNFIDRARLNYVVDFFEFKFINFPIFNVADILVVCGVILLGYATIFLKYEF